MKKIRLLTFVMVVIILCGMIWSFFICPLPDFVVFVDGFAEYKITNGRFLVITPLESDSFFTYNKKGIPQFRYISAHERVKINERLDYFVENADESDIKNQPTGLRGLNISINDRVYESELRFSFNLPEYCKDFMYDGAMELWVEVTKNNLLFSAEPIKVAINYWMWMYGDECRGVSEEEYNKTPTPVEKGELSKLELFIESIITWYWEKF